MGGFYSHDHTMSPVLLSRAEDLAMERMLTWMVMGAVAGAAFLGCGDDDGMGGDSGIDSGPRPDTGPPRDTGPRPDTGMEEDSGMEMDSGPPTPCDDPVIPALATEMVGDFNSPIYATQAPGSTDTIWVV